MLLATDVHYRSGTAKAVCIAFRNWSDEAPVQVYETWVPEVAEYLPGQFYRRELPCILAVLQTVDLTDAEALIIDGYVVLNDAGEYGLGGHLYEALERKIPVIGVAKTRFHLNSKHVAEVRRGKSQNPLFVTSIGIPLEQAAAVVQGMAGNYRMPHLLQLLDKQTKK